MRKEKKSSQIRKKFKNKDVERKEKKIKERKNKIKQKNKSRDIQMTVLEVDKKNKDPQRKKGRNYKLKNERGIIVNCQKNTIYPKMA